jgi:hypothetical protein
MFDLETAIAQWRRRVADVAAISAAQAAELEDHLRTEVDALRPHLSEEEAFSIAIRRVGDLDRIGTEFEIADPSAAWRGHAAWLATGILVTLVFANVRAALTQLSMWWLQHRHASTIELTLMPFVVPIAVALVVVALSAVALHRASPRPWRQVIAGWVPIAVLTFCVNDYVRSREFTDQWSPAIATSHEHSVMYGAMTKTPIAMFVVQLAICACMLAMSRRRQSRLGKLGPH